MKTVIYFLLTTCISTGAFFAATNMKDPFPALTAAFGIWVLFFWVWHRRLKKEAAQRHLEDQFREYPHEIA